MSPSPDVNPGSAEDWGSAEDSQGGEIIESVDVPEDDWGSAAEEGTPVVETRSAYESDVIFFRFVAVALGLVMLTSAVGAVWLAYSGRDVPDGLVAIGSAAVGGLASVLSKR